MEEMKKLLQTNMDFKMHLARVDSLLTLFKNDTIWEKEGNSRYDQNLQHGTEYHITQYYICNSTIISKFCQLIFIFFLLDHRMAQHKFSWTWIDITYDSVFYLFLFNDQCVNVIFYFLLA